MPSEQPREGTQERYIDQWPKPMFLCTHCDEQTDSDPCQECASVFDERGENYPPVLRFQVVPAPAQPEQPRGEGDDLAARLEEKSNVEEGLRPARPTNLPGPDLYHLGRAEAFAEAAQLARASTHPEQSERVDPEQLRLVRNMAKTEASQSDPEQAPAFTDERRASHRRRADALNAVLAALEPAPPTPTEQGEARVEYRIRTGRFPTAAMPLDQAQRLARDGDVIECRTLTDWTALEPAPPTPTEQEDD